MNKVLAGLLVSSIALSAQVKPAIEEYTYAVVISEETYADPAWRDVADELKEKHSAVDSRIFTWDRSITFAGLKDSLSSFMPTYIAFVAKPVDECNSFIYSKFSEFVRTLDNDPYPDAIWSFVTGYEAADALRAVKDSLKIKTMLWGSGGANETAPSPLRRFKQGVGIECNSYTRTKYSFPDGQVLDIEERPDNNTDRVPLLSQWFNSEDINVTVDGYPTISGPLDLIQTGGHGFKQGWQTHYNDAGVEGYIISENGQLYGKPYEGDLIPITIPTPKVYTATVNCLVGNPDNINNMVYAWFHTGRAINMHGFIPNAEPGNEFMGYGVYDRFTKFSGKFNLPESYYYAQVNSVYEMNNPTGFYRNDRIDYFLDTVAIYGDPKANAYIECDTDSNHIYLEDLTVELNSDQDSATFSYTVTVLAPELTKNKHFSHQMRPMAFLPHRIDPESVEILNNAGEHADIVDNLIIWDMMAVNETISQGESRTISWNAKLAQPLVETGQEVAVSGSVTKANVIALTWRNNRLALSGTFSQTPTLTLSSLRGRVVYNGAAEPDLINAISLSSGVYLWQITSDHQTVSGKLIRK